MKKVFLFISVLMLTLITSASAQDKVLVGDLEQYIRNAQSEKINVVVSGVTDKNQRLLSDALRNCNKPISLELASDPKFTKVGYFAFAECGVLESIVIPEGVKEIGTCAFSDCHSLVNVVLPSSLTDISGPAFNNCKSLKSITIPEGVLHIDMFTFAGCTALKFISLPKGLTWIRCNAFENCTSLESINIPEGVEFVDFPAFEGCTSLKGLNVPKNAGWGNTKFENGHIRSIELIPERYYDFYGHSFFKDLEFLETVVVSYGITEIRKNQFADCKSLKSVTLPESIVELPFCAFEGCDNLESLKVPVSAGWGIYKYEKGHLISVEVPDFVKKIDFKALDGCDNLEAIFVTKAQYDKYSKKHPKIKLKN